MNKSIPPILQWKHIFLETSFIIDYTKDPNRFFKQPLVKSRIECVKEIISILEDRPLPNKKDNRIYYISSITVGELMKLTNRNATNSVINLFSKPSHNVRFVDYSTNIANLQNRKLEDYLPDGQKFQLISKLKKELDAENFMNARQWIIDDLKIAATAKSVKNLDVILTSDRKTFLPIAEKMQLPCLYMDKEKMNKDLFGEISGNMSFLMK